MPHFLMLFDCFISDLKLNLALLDCFSPLLIDIFILIISFNALILINKLIIETIQDIIEVDIFVLYVKSVLLVCSIEALVMLKYLY